MKDPTTVHLVTCSETSVKLWAPPNYELSRELVPPHAASNISNICYDHVNNRIISCNVAAQGTVATNLNDDESELLTPEINAFKIDLSFNCKYLLGGTLQGKVTLLDVKSKKVKQTYSEHSWPVSIVKISSRSHSIAASGDTSGEVISYNIASGKSNKLNSSRLGDKQQPVSALNFSPFRNGVLCSGDDSGIVTFWDTSMCCETTSFGSLHDSTVTSLSFSPVNEMLLLTSSLNRRLVYLDTTAHTTVKTVHTEKLITSSCLLSDGTTSAVATEDGLVLLYDLRKLDTPTFFFTSHFKSPISHLSQLTAPPSYSSKRSLTGSVTSLNEANGGGKTSSGFSSSGFTSTSENESDAAANTTAAEQHSQSSNRSTGSAPLRASHALQHSGSPTAMAAAAIMTSKTPPIKRPLSTSNVGPNVGLPSYYAGGSVFSPLESGYASSMNDLYSKSKLANGSSPVQSPLASELQNRIPRTSSNDDSLTSVSECNSVRKSSATPTANVLNKKPPQHNLNFQSNSSIAQTQTESAPMSNGFHASSSSSAACVCGSNPASSSLGAPDNVDLLRKTILESTESVKVILQKEFSNAQINSYNDFFTLKKMIEKLTEENESMKAELAGLKETVNKMQYRANFFG